MRLIVVDDDHLVVDSLKIILGAQPQIEVVGTGADGDDAVALYAEHAPDIALLDIQMPKRDGLSAAREILERDPAARVVFLTTFSDDEYIVSALKLGARGYLIKTDVAAIPPALAQVMDGKRVLEGKAIEDIDFDGTGVEAGTTRRPAAFVSLTDREFEVAELIARGLDNKEIAATVEAFHYQIGKEIGAMAAAMCGRVDAVILTGGIAHNEFVVRYIEQHCSFIAPVSVYPGENELESLVANALVVLRGTIVPKVYA